MARFGPLLLALVALVAAGCGNSMEEKRKQQIQSICNGFVPGTTTYADAVQALAGGEFGNMTTACRSDFVPSGTPPDLCVAGAGVCKVDFEFFLNDTGACPSSPAGPECWYYCELRFAQADVIQPAPPGLPNQNAISCARDFIMSPLQAF
jgi:hypothetical protein